MQKSVSNGTPATIATYTYSSGWGDLLTQYNGQNFTYTIFGRYIETDTTEICLQKRRGKPYALDYRMVLLTTKDSKSLWDTSLNSFYFYGNYPIPLVSEDIHRTESFLVGRSIVQLDRFIEDSDSYYSFQLAAGIPFDSTDIAEFKRASMDK